jgi:hypothetical protein
VPKRDRLRNSRGLKRTETGQRFLEGFEAIRHLRPYQHSASSQTLRELLDVIELLDDAMKEGAEVYYSFLNEREARQLSAALRHPNQNPQRTARRPPEFL